MLLVKVEYEDYFDGYSVDLCTCNSVDEAIEIEKLLNPLIKKKSSKYRVVWKEMENFQSTRKFRNSLKEKVKNI